jgi:hypothetical protein
MAEEASRLLGQVEDEPGRADDRSRRKEDRVELEWSVVEESEGCPPHSTKCRPMLGIRIPLAA